MFIPADCYHMDLKTLGFTYVFIEARSFDQTAWLQLITQIIRLSCASYP
jgi:hypothetical protein